MSLLKEITFPNSTTASYWKIVGIRDLSLLTKKGTVIVRGYVNKSTRESDVAAGVADRAFVITFPDVTQNLAEQAYTILKTLSPENGNLQRPPRRIINPDGTITVIPVPEVNAVPFFDGATDA